jgi:hypothetical protein
MLANVVVQLPTTIWTCVHDESLNPEIARMSVEHVSAQVFPCAAQASLQSL